MMEKKTIDNILVLDTETGGLNATTDGLMSVTMKVYNKPIIKTFYIKPNNKLNYSEEAININGITIDYLEKNGISENAFIGELTKFINDNFDKKPNVLGQNIGFDIDFINELMLRNNMHSFHSMIWHQKRDTEAVSRFFQDAGLGLEKVNLSDAYKFFVGKELVDAHTSEADVLATEELYKAQINYIKEKLK